MAGAKPDRNAARGVLDACLLVVLVVLCTQVASPAFRASRRSEQIQEAGREARALYDAFRSYRERNGAYPDERTAPEFDPATLEPLRRRGYYRGAIGTHLVGGRIDAYDAPDDQGPNREFWMEMTLASDPSVRILVAKSDDAPLGRGNFVDGVFVVRGGTMEPL